jgi:TonB-linked SusC/RagA family outer membrane protein
MHPILLISDRLTNSFRNTNTVNYDLKNVLKNNEHVLRVLLGHEMITVKKQTTSNEIQNFPDFFLLDKAMALTAQGTPVSMGNTYAPDDKLLSFFGRINYDFRDRYLLTATYRADGSSKFARGKRWGYFPSAALAWRISSESFMEDTKQWLDDLKIRASIGAAGNNNIPDGQMFQSYEAKTGGTSVHIKDFNTMWVPSKTMANPDLVWETTYTRNAGIDFTLLNSKLTGSVDFYLNNTKDLLIEFPTAGVGYSTQYRNMGETENKGLEIQLNYRAINKQDFGLDFNFNIGFNKNEIKSLGVMKDFGFGTEWSSTEIGEEYWVAVGGPVGQMYGYLSDGRYELSDFEGYDSSTKKWILKDGVANASAIVGTLRPGVLKLKDISGNDNTVSADDRTIIGDANPLHTGGFTVNSRFYGFDLSAAFNWSYGNDIYNANKINFTMTSKHQYLNLLTIMGDGQRWTNMTADGQLSNDPAVLAELNKNTTMWSPYTSRYILSDWAIEDGSFLRLNTLTLGYTLPAKWMQQLKINSLRIYASAYNLYCWTNYSGFDPEVSTRRKTNLTPGVDYSAYPKSRQVLFGLNLNF